MNIGDLSPKDLHRYAKGAKAENKRYPAQLIALPRSKWGELAAKITSPIFEVWRSRGFLCQVYRVPGFDYMERLSVCRTEVDLEARSWREGITWDELMEVKRQVGRGEFDAVEIYPRDEDIVNVANMRHLWVSKHEWLPFAWRRGVHPLALPLGAEGKPK